MGLPTSGTNPRQRAELEDFPSCTRWRGPCTGPTVMPQASKSRETASRAAYEGGPTLVSPPASFVRHIHDASPTLVDCPWTGELILDDDEAATRCILRPGAWLGHNEIVIPLGEEGAATIWLARHHGKDNRPRLVSILTLPLDRSFGAAERFQEDCRHAAAIRHVNVAELVEHGESGGALYVASEWLHGVSLEEVLRPIDGPARPIPCAIAGHLIAEACAGLHAAHELVDPAGRSRAIVHREVGHSVVRIASSGQVRVAGFGTARALAAVRASTGDDSADKMRASILTTAPEVLVGGAVDRRSDVFSLGAILYEATIGIPAFAGDTAAEVLESLLRGAPIAPRDIEPDYPVELEAIVLRALQRDPARRFPTAAAFQAALEPWVARGGSKNAHAARLAHLSLDRAGSVVLERRALLRKYGDVSAASGLHPIVSDD
jgi:serine/threonine-protein kinase